MTSLKRVIFEIAFASVQYKEKERKMGERGKGRGGGREGLKPNIYE